MISGRILKVQVPEKLAHTFFFDPEGCPGTQADAATVVSYTLTAQGSKTVLTLVHSGFEEENQTLANVTGGWPFILDGLKKALEEPAAGPGQAAFRSRRLP